MSTRLLSLAKIANYAYVPLINRNVSMDVYLVVYVILYITAPIGLRFIHNSLNEKRGVK